MQLFFLGTNSVLTPQTNDMSQEKFKLSGEAISEADLAQLEKDIAATDDATVKAALEAHKKQQEEARQYEIVQGLNRLENTIKREVQGLKSARKGEKDALARLGAANEAKARFLKTGNLNEVSNALADKGVGLAY
jgi:hypothetical protein